MRTYSVSWSDDDDEWVATVSDAPSLSWLAATPDKALAGLVALTNSID